MEHILERIRREDIKERIRISREEDEIVERISSILRSRTLSRDSYERIKHELDIHISRERTRMYGRQMTMIYDMLKLKDLEKDFIEKDFIEKDEMEI